MSSTKKTTYLDLSQFENTDKPSWLADYNKDMKKIDDGFHEIGQSSESTDVVIKHLQDEIDRGITADEYAKHQMIAEFQDELTKIYSEMYAAQEALDYQKKQEYESYQEIMNGIIILYHSLQ